MIFIRSALWISAICTAAYAAAAGFPRSTGVIIRDIAQFPNGTWIENAIFRESNGKLLVTLLTTPDIYQVDPSGKTQPQRILSIPGYLGVLGIAELSEDVYAVIAGNFSLTTFATVPGSYAIWKVDLRSSPPKSSKVTDIPAANLLNGMSILDTKGNILVGDAGVGVVYRVDAYTGNYTIVLDEPEMKPLAGGSLQLGINGLHTRGAYLYFSSTTQGLFARVPIHPDGTANGAVQVIAKPGIVDDFTFDASGNAFVCTNSGNTVIKVTPAGKVTTVAGSANSTTVAGATSAHFGLGANVDTLYVTQDGQFNSVTYETHVIAITGLV